MVKLVGLCAIGAEKVLSNELKHLGYSINSKDKFRFGRVSFFDQKSDDLISIYKANLNLRTADRVFIEVAEFTSLDFDSLFDGVYQIPWEDWFKKDSKITVDKVRINKSKLSSEHSVQSITHKAIYKRLGDKWKMSSLPETGDRFNVRIYIDNNTIQVLLDSSGDPLHRRGYRTSGGEAPIRETLAAILLLFAGWRRKTPLHDAFCGAGTIPIEACLYAHDIAPGLGRNFALEGLAPFLSEQASRKMKAERERAAKKIRTDCLVRITGSDLDLEAVNRSASNAERACGIAGKALQSIGSDARILRPSFTQASFTELKAPYEEGFLFGNPPWGERLTDKQEAESLYQKMESLFKDFANWNMGFISCHKDFEMFINKKTSKKRSFKSGNIDTIFYYY